MFKIQKKLTPDKYFSFSDIIYGMDFIPTRLAALIRVLLIYLLGLVSIFFFKDTKVVLIGLTFGSFLIVWPGFLDPINVDPRVVNKKFTLYSMFVFFVLSTYFITKLSIISFDIIEEFLSIYLRSFDNTERIITLFGDFIFTSTLALLIGYFLALSKKQLNKEIILKPRAYFQEELDNQEYFSSDSSYVEQVDESFEKNA